METIVEICTCVTDIGSTIFGQKTESIDSILNLYRNISSFIPIIKELAQEKNENTQNYLQELLVLSKEIQKFVDESLQESYWITKKIKSATIYYYKVKFYEKRLEDLKKNLTLGVNVSRHQVQSKLFDTQVKLRQNISSVFQNVDDEIIVWEILRKQQEIFEKRLSDMEEANLAQLLDSENAHDQCDEPDCETEDTLVDKMESMYQHFRRENYTLFRRISELSESSDESRLQPNQPDNSEELTTLLLEIEMLEASFETMEVEHSKKLLEQEHEFSIKKASLKTQIMSLERKIKSQQDVLVSLQSQKSRLLQEVNSVKSEYQSVVEREKKGRLEHEEILKKYAVGISDTEDLINYCYIKVHKCVPNLSTHNCWQQCEPTPYTCPKIIDWLRAWQKYEAQYGPRSWNYKV